MTDPKTFGLEQKPVNICGSEMKFKATIQCRQVLLTEESGRYSQTQAQKFRRAVWNFLGSSNTFKCRVLTGLKSRHGNFV